MELANYFKIARRWLWLIILVAVVAGSIVFIVARSRPTEFRSSVTLQFGNYLGLSDPNPSMIQAAAALSQSYITILRSTTVLALVIQKLNLPISPEALSRSFETRVISETSFLVLTVTYTDPALSAEIAESLALALIENSPSDLTTDQQKELDILRTEIREAGTRLTSTRDELRVVEDRLAKQGLETNEQAVLTGRRAELISEINTVQSSLAVMSQTASQLRRDGSINYIRIFDKPRTPVQSSNSNPLQPSLAAALVGALIAFGIGFLIEHFNDSLRAPGEINAVLQLPLLGIIPPFNKGRRDKPDRLPTWLAPRSPIAEAYRALRVNILFRNRDSSTDQATLIYLITSPNPGEGKSITTSNMAVTFAMTGMNVLLIDTDLRRPTIHEIFNLPNTLGMSTLWLRDANVVAQPSIAVNGYSFQNNFREVEAQIQQEVRQTIPAIIQKADIPNLSIITSGPILINPSEILDTPQMHSFVRQITAEMHYDIILFDTPPILAVADTSILANVSGGKVILVVESRRTQRGAALRAIEQMSSLSVSIIGVVMNRLKAVDRDYGYYQYYGYSQYGSQAPQTNANEVPKKH